MHLEYFTLLFYYLVITLVINVENNCSVCTKRIVYEFTEKINFNHFNSNISHSQSVYFVNYYKNKIETILLRGDNNI